VVEPPARYCAAHQRALEQARPTAWQRGYDTAWRGWRLAILQREPLCRHCRAKGLVVPATEVDHIRPKQDGGAESWENLQPLCKACHARKTLGETRGRPA
jgi:5-methylcytosine-specific restriction protein A